jgi:hypothetical protein
VPAWGGNALLVAEGSVAEPSSFVAYDRKGAVVFSAGFSVEGAAHANVYSFARGADGTAGICGLAFDREGRRAPFISWISADGSTQKIIRTEPYVPELITVAPDGTLWTVGYELNPDLLESSGVDRHAGVLRHWDRAGKQLAAWIPRSSLSTFLYLNPTNGFLSAGKERVGWLRFLPAQNEGAYVEALPGGTIVEYPLPALPLLSGGRSAVAYGGLALTDAEDVYVTAWDIPTRQHASAYRLDRAARQWIPVALPGGGTTKFALLYGASGAELVMRLPDDPNSGFTFLRAAR